MNKWHLDHVGEELRKRGRLPGCYAIDSSNWLTCMGCYVTCIFPGELPTHASDCAVGVRERDTKTEEPR